MLMKSALFWDIMRRGVVIVYRRFGTTCQSNLHGSRVGVGKIESQQTIGCPETSVNNYHTTPRNIPEERRSLAMYHFNQLNFIREKN
jgi:hypothetical protein